jgi:hypothetical protein
VFLLVSCGVREVSCMLESAASHNIAYCLGLYVGV